MATKTRTPEAFEYDLNDLRITTPAKEIKKGRAAGGVWIDGTLAGHRFQALVFADHAECEEYELGTSKISKLWVQCLADKKGVFNWDRGMDQPAETDLAQAIVDFLAAGLADLIYA
jgi:hypothetical protein